LKSGEITVTHPYPQSFYADGDIRGAKVDMKQKMSMQLTLKLLPQKDGATRIDVTEISVTGGTLPDDRYAVLSKINEQME
jgi:outer membrane protein assembly factor BamC